MEQRKITTAQGTVYYWISEHWDPERDTLMFLHGMTADHTMFASQMAHFAGENNIVAWDAPAHGASRPYENFSYPHAAQALYDILETQQISSAVLIGQSMGGFMAQAFLARHPERVKAFVGIDTTPYGTGYYSKSDVFWLRQVEWMAHLYPVGAMKRAMAKQIAVTPEGQRNMLDMLKPYGKQELCHLMGIGYAGFLADNRDLEITCPVLLLIGEQDKTGKVRQYNRAWAQKTRFPLEIIPDAAHNSNVDNPAAVNEAIARFLESISATESISRPTRSTDSTAARTPRM